MTNREVDYLISESKNKMKKLTQVMSKRMWLSLFLWAISVCAFSQKNTLSSEIQYISSIPVIDGYLDDDLDFLCDRSFPVIKGMISKESEISAKYKLAYGAEFLYVYIEATADKLVFRDRAYQNGDGFQMVLAKPKPDGEATDEFYVLACSAVDSIDMEWTRNIFWYYNVDNIFQETSVDTKLEFSEKEGKIAFELLLPWKDVYPYHPWISEAIGFNLCFVKAIDDNAAISYKVLDAPIGNENSNREYLKLKFSTPKHQGNPRTVLILDKNHIVGEDSLIVTTATISSQSFDEVIVMKLLTSGNTLLDVFQMGHACQPGISINHFVINPQLPKSDQYMIDWLSKSNDSKGTINITSLPPFEISKINLKLKRSKRKISVSSQHTFKYLASEIAEEIIEAKPYEICAKLQKDIVGLNQSLDNALRGIDDYAIARGFVRKAYKSDLDGSLQPYMVYIPANYNSEQKYPLLVFLHGSASDETNLKGLNFVIPDGFVAVAPFGRGPSNCFAWDNAQEDISECIDEVIGDYSIDRDKIILSGFSMGGYGVYRTFFQTPQKFKGLAIFSGHPNLANAWTGEKSYPDFTSEEYLDDFCGIPVFVFHGKEDRNCPFQTTENVVKKLEKVGAKVCFISEEGKGHESPGAQTIISYNHWADSIF